MNKIASWILASLLLLATGCATVSTQYNTMESMKTYVFNESAEDVFAGVTQVFTGDNNHLTSTGKYMGVSPWRVRYKSQGSLSHNEKVRYNVAVSTVNGNQTVVRIMRESIPDTSDPLNIGRLMGSEVLTPETRRDIAYEFRILEHVNPSAAAAMKASAAK